MKREEEGGRTSGRVLTLKSQKAGILQMGGATRRVSEAGLSWVRAAEFPSQSGPATATEAGGVDGDWRTGPQRAKAPSPPPP